MWRRPQVSELTAGSNSDPHKMAGALAARVRPAAADRQIAARTDWMSCAAASSVVSSCSAAVLLQLLASAGLLDSKPAMPTGAMRLLRWCLCRGQGVLLRIRRR